MGVCVAPHSSQLRTSELVGASGPFSEAGSRGFVGSPGAPGASVFASSFVYSACVASDEVVSSCFAADSLSIVTSILEVVSIISGSGAGASNGLKFGAKPAAGLVILCV